MQLRAHLLPKQHREYAELRRDPEAWMARQLAQEEEGDAVPSTIDAPDILGDYNIWNITHWDYWTMRNQPETWMTKILLAHGESNRIQTELYESMYRIDSRESRGRPINDAEIEEVRANNPKLANLPAAALRKLYRKRNG